MIKSVYKTSRAVVRFCLESLKGSRLAEGTSVYAGAEIIFRIVSIGLLPILTRYLAPDEYGSVAVFVAVNGALLPIVGLNGNSALARKYFDYKDGSLSEYIGDQYKVLAIGVIIVGLALIPLAGFAAELLGVSMYVVLSAYILSVFRNAEDLCLQYLQVSEQPYSYAALRGAGMVVSVVMSLVLVVGFDWGARGRIVGILVGAGLAALGGGVVLVRRVGITITKGGGYVAEILRFCLPLTPGGLSSWAVKSVDRLLISSMLGASATGIYEVGYKVGASIRYMSTSFGRAWRPVLFRTLKADMGPTTRKKRRIVFITYLYLAALSAVSIGVGVFGDAIVSIVAGDQFQQAGSLVIWVALGQAANMCYSTFSEYIFFDEQTRILGIIKFGQAVLNGGLNVVLIGAMGVEGAAIATFITYGVAAAIITILATRKRHMDWSIRSLVSDIA